MTTAPALIPELDDIVRRGDPKRRAEAARKLSELFLQGAANFRSDHVDLFDGVLSSLVPHAEIAARVELAERLSVLSNAPRHLEFRKHRHGVLGCRRHQGRCVHLGAVADRRRDRLPG